MFTRIWAATKISVIVCAHSVNGVSVSLSMAVCALCVRCAASASVRSRRRSDCKRLRILCGMCVCLCLFVCNRKLCCLFCVLMNMYYTCASPLTICTYDHYAIKHTRCGSQLGIFHMVYGMILPNRIRRHMWPKRHYGISPLLRSSHAISAICWWSLRICVF